MMDVKTYLRQIGRKDARIKGMLERQQRYRDMATHSTQVYRDMPGGGRRSASSCEEYVCKIVDLEREMDRAIDEYVDITREVERAIDALPDDRHRDILRFRYVNGWGWDKIAAAMGYSVDWVWHLHGKAVLMVDKTRQTKTVLDVL
ncbi:MAG: DUF1492 domain-containing protein [Clostridia bacterium]